MAQPNDLSPVNPDELMAGVARLAFVWTLLFSLVVHVAVIFGTSIGYMRLMAQYHSLHPRFEIKRLNKDKREGDMTATRKAAQERILAEQAKREAQEKAGDKKGTAEQDTGTKAGGEKDKPKILKELEKTSNERPKESTTGLDDIKDLE